MRHLAHPRTPRALRFPPSRAPFFFFSPLSRQSANLCLQCLSAPQLLTTWPGKADHGRFPRGDANSRGSIYAIDKYSASHPWRRDSHARGSLRAFSGLRCAFRYKRSGWPIFSVKSTSQKYDIGHHTSKERGRVTLLRVLLARDVIIGTTKGRGASSYDPRGERSGPRRPPPK